MTPHLGAATAEGQDRAGVIVAEQVVAGLSGGVVTYAVNIPSISREDMDAIGPFLPLAEMLGQLISAISDGPLSKVTVQYEGEVAEHDTRLLTLAVTKGLVAAGSRRGGQLRECAHHRRRARTADRGDEGATLARLHQPHLSHHHRPAGRDDGGGHGVRAQEPAPSAQDLPAQHRHRTVGAHGVPPLRRHPGHDRADRHHHRHPR